MGTALPAVGAQVRRKVDGTLGEVYSIDPPHNLLRVRFPTVPGAFNRQVYTPDQFSRSCELTGVLVGPPHETHVAISLIIALVLLTFVVVLVKGSNSLYVGYDPYHPVVPGPANIARNARALNEKFGMAAAEACAGGADEYIRSVAAHRFHWNGGNGLTPRFDQFVSTVSAPGVLTMFTNKAAVFDGFGKFSPITVYCNYDTASHEVLSYSSSIDNE